MEAILFVVRFAFDRLRPRPPVAVNVYRAALITYSMAFADGDNLTDRRTGRVREIPQDELPGPPCE
ncbi:MAG TPA: hypothetical protein VGD29_32970 [Actinoplanes sp.]